MVRQKCEIGGENKTKQKNDKGCIMKTKRIKGMRISDEEWKARVALCILLIFGTQV